MSLTPKLEKIAILSGTRIRLFEKHSLAARWAAY